MFTWAPFPRHLLSCDLEGAFLAPSTADKGVSACSHLDMSFKPSYVLAKKSEMQPLEQSRDLELLFLSRHWGHCLVRLHCIYYDKGIHTLISVYML